MGETGSNEKTIRISLIAMALMFIVVLGIPLWKMIRFETAPPSDDDLFNFAYQNMTAAQIDNVKKQAHAQYERDYKKAYDDYKEALRNAYTVSPQCKDFGYSAKHPQDCHKSLPLGLIAGFNPMIADEETDYDVLLLGGCAFVKTVHRARRDGCLPSNYGGVSQSFFGKYFFDWFE